MNYRLNINSNMEYEVYQDRGKYRLRIWVQKRGHGLYFDSMDTFDESGECNALAKVIDQYIIEKNFKINPVEKKNHCKILLRLGKDYLFINPRKFTKLFNLERSVVKLNDLLTSAG